MGDTVESVAAPDADDRAAWLHKLDQIGEDSGYFEPLGKRHWAFFVDDSPTLVVTFETAEAIRTGSPAQLPMGHAIAAEQGWSHLCIIADGETWYRDEAVYRYFDRLVDDAFFEDFDRVVFYGAGMGGYAAACFSVTAPGATVIAVSPVASLDPRVSEWDGRFRHARRLDFTRRYGFAPDMIEGAGEVFVIYDPEVTLDAMHAALFTRPFVHKLRCRHFGAAPEAALSDIGVVGAMIRAGAKGRVAPSTFHRAFRQRRSHTPYILALLDHIDRADRPKLAHALCANVLKRLSAPRISDRYEALRTRLREHEERAGSPEA